MNFILFIHVSHNKKVSYKSRRTTRFIVLYPNFPQICYHAFTEARTYLYTLFPNIHEVKFITRTSVRKRNPFINMNLDAYSPRWRSES